MSADVAIQVEHLGKRYRLGAAPVHYSFRDTVGVRLRMAVSSMKHAIRGKHKPPSDGRAFWALNDVSFSIQRGDRVGIIGRNGAGKSTLLKILSRITEPTTGQITLRGRVASLLEVGTGFHPELTGRENIFLNGAVLGMSKTEIRRKFDEIVAFAEVSRFLDTPVKRYSSGMYVRLAFAVAAHLEPEILIVDEVLAVGDAQFQQKCLGKMQDVAQNGRTVLFVIHNMAAIRQLCNSAILLEQGRVKYAGTAEAGVMQYLRGGETDTGNACTRSEYGIALEKIYFEEHLDDGNRPAQEARSLVFNRDYRLQLSLSADQPLTDAAVVIRIFDAMGTLVSSICTPEEGIHPFRIEYRLQLTFQLPRLPLLPGRYRASVFVYRSNDPMTYLAAEDAISFEVHPAIVQSAMWAYRPDHGIVRLAQAGSLMQL
ncbi:MAG: ABC transporter ATP-binding protein [Cyanobacteria bacterium J06648_11]